MFHRITDAKTTMRFIKAIPFHIHHILVFSEDQQTGTCFMTNISNYRKIRAAPCNRVSPYINHFNE